MSYSAHHRRPLSSLRRVSNSLRSFSTLPFLHPTESFRYLRPTLSVVATFRNLVTILLFPFFLLFLPDENRTLLYGFLWRNRIEWLILYLIRGWPLPFQTFTYNPYIWKDYRRSFCKEKKRRLYFPFRVLKFKVQSATSFKSTKNTTRFVLSNFQRICIFIRIGR